MHDELDPRTRPNGGGIRLTLIDDAGGLDGLIGGDELIYNGDIPPGGPLGIDNAPCDEPLPI